MRIYNVAGVVEEQEVGPTGEINLESMFKKHKFAS